MTKLTRDEQIKLLYSSFPVLFLSSPLAVGIAAQIKENLPEGVSMKTVRFVLRRYTSTGSYIASVAAGNQRFNLDGSSAGTPSPENIAYAKGQIEGFGTAKRFYKQMAERKESKRKNIAVSSPELYRIYCLWRRRANRLLFKGNVKRIGLCEFISYHSPKDKETGDRSYAQLSEFRKQLKQAGLVTDYPFGGEDEYNDDAVREEMHLNPMRRGWVDSRIHEYRRAHNL